MKLIFLGPPGAGKGTQAMGVAEHYGIAHISTGDMLRSEIREGTSLGREAQAYMDKGELVPDSVIVGMVKNRIAQEDCKTASSWTVSPEPLHRLRLWRRSPISIM